MDDVTSPSSDPGSCPCTADALRAELAEGVRTRSVTVVDPDGFERIRLTADGDGGHVVLRTRGPGGDVTQVDLFALDAEDATDRPYVGVELVDRGTSVAGLALYEGRHPRLWTHDT